MAPRKAPAWRATHRLRPRTNASRATMTIRPTPSSASTAISTSRPFPVLLGRGVEGEPGTEVRAAADVVDTGDPLRVGAGGDDRLGPCVEVVEQLVEVVVQGVDQRAFELVGADLDLLPEGPAGLGDPLVVGH